MPNKTAVFFFAPIVLLSVGFGYLFFQISEIKTTLSNAVIPMPTSSPDPVITPTPQAPTQKTIIIQSTPAPASHIAYIPIGGSSNTQNADWTDVPNAQVYLDLANDYNKNAKASWEAFLKVENANGTAYARLYDATHSIGVVGSEIKLTDNDKYTLVSSGNLNLWSGRNLYKIQIKSLNTFPVYVDSGRIKITY